MNLWILIPAGLWLIGTVTTFTHAWHRGYIDKSFFFATPKGRHTLSERVTYTSWALVVVPAFFLLLWPMIEYRLFKEFPGE